MLAGVGVSLALGVTLAAVPLSNADDGRPSTFRTVTADRCSPLHSGPAGSPDLLVVADLSLQPGVVSTTSPMVDAMTLVLEQRDFRAGRHRIGLQVCDAATPDSVYYDARTCRANARMYARNPSVIGVVGPLTSVCAKLEIPILNRAPRGPVAMVSPSNTYVGLTRRSPTAPDDEPAAFYPTGKRNYARVVPADDAQAAAAVIVARRLGLERIYVLEPPGYDVPMVDDFVRSAARLGIKVTGHGTWGVEEGDYAPLAADIARTRADGVFLAGGPDHDGVQLLRDLRAGLGPGVQVMASDGFDPTTAVLAGAAAEGMTISHPGPSNEYLRAAGKQFVAAFTKKFGAEPTRFVVAAAQAMDVLLDAIGRSDGTRSSVTENLFTTRVSNGILGSFWITPSGDTTLNAVAIQRIINGEVTTFDTVVVPDALLTPSF